MELYEFIVGFMLLTLSIAVYLDWQVGQWAHAKHAELEETMWEHREKVRDLQDALDEVLALVKQA